MVHIALPNGRTSVELPIGYFSELIKDIMAIELSKQPLNQEVVEIIKKYEGSL